MDKLTPEDSDWDRAERMAEFGCEIFVAEDFVENQTPPPFRNSYLDVVGAFHFQSLEDFNNGTVLIIPDSTSAK